MATIAKAYHLNPSRPNQTKHVPYMNGLLYPHYVFITTICISVLVFRFIPFLANQYIHTHEHMLCVHVIVFTRAAEKQPVSKCWVVLWGDPQNTTHLALHLLSSLTS